MKSPTLVAMPRAPDSRPSRAQAALLGLGFGLVFYGITLAVGLSKYRFNGRFAYDQFNYHEPTVRFFAQTFPRADFSNYWSATTPLYHYLLAGVAQAFPSRTALMAAGGLFSVGVLALLVYACARRVGSVLAVAFVLPLAASLNFFTQGVWMLPDNAGWLGVLAVLLIAIQPRFNAMTLVGGSVALALLVSTRQIHAWTGGVLLAAAWLGAPPKSPAPDSFAGLFTDVPARLKRCALAGVATLPALAITIWFVWLWSGLVVPRYQQKYHGFNAATPAFFFAIIGGLAPFYTGALWPSVVNTWRRHRVLLVSAIVIAIVAAAAPETTYNVEAGRYSGLWNYTKHAPIIAHHTSVLILALSPIGAAALVALCVGAPRRTGWILAAAATGFCLTQFLSPELWHRYHEPLIFFLLTLGSADTVRARRMNPDAPQDSPLRFAVTVAGPVILAAVYALVTARAITSHNPVGPASDGAYHIADQAEPITPAPRQAHP